MNPAQTVLQAGVTTFLHPLAYVKTLIQVGYEPLVPVPSTTLFGSKILMYPNVFKYIGHIKKTEGFLGLYRGLTPRLLSNIISSIVSNSVSSELAGLPVGAVSPEEQSKDSNEYSVSKLIKDSTYESLARCAGTIVSQPFYVISIRSMCQIVGQETKYNTVFSSISEIYNSEGILGFFSGLVPRLLGELLTIWLANTLTHVVSNVILSIDDRQSQERRTYSSTFSQLVVTQITYPFLVVSSVMSISDSGLAAASLPLAAKYSGWLDCWSHLARAGQLKRGSAMFWRAYKGPIQIGRDGNLVPAIEPF